MISPDANVASIQSFVALPNSAAYTTSKGGVRLMTKALAMELGAMGIRVNAVAPGFVDTRRLRSSLGSGRQAELARTPAGRLATPDEIAAAVAFLASDDAAYFVGATLSPNGGLLTSA